MIFNPVRLTVARQRRMLNKKELAAAVDLTDYTIMRCEMGKNMPTDENIQKFSKALHFPVEFFFGNDLDIPDPNLVSFRSQKAMTASLRDAALAAGAIGFMISDWVEAGFNLPKINVPDLHLSDPETAARTLRQEWDLGEKPISNMIHLLESKGIRVLSLAENTKRVNAFSVWRKNKPYIFLNTMKSSESSRFDAAHELGHLVLHQDGKTRGREAEDQANSFASAFLMPKADLMAVLPRVYSLDEIKHAKKRWRVSVAALNYGLHKNGVTTDWRYRDFCIEIAKRGYNKNEPDSIDREKSVVWEKILRTLWQERTTKTDIAGILHLPESELDSLVFGMLHAGAKAPQTKGHPLRLIN